MSSLAEGLSSRPRAAALSLPRVSADVVLATSVGITLAAVCFAAGGGLELERTTSTEVGLILLGSALVGWVALARPLTEKLRGGPALLSFVVLAAYTTLSITWSVSPADSWLEANRTFAYAAALAGAIALVRLAPERWAAVLHGVILGCVLVCGWALLTKIFPGTLGPGETFARLREPFGYWNSVGLMAVLGIPPVLWLAARRSGHPAANALAWPALGLLLICLMLSYSRGALLALLIGLAFWFALVPLRLRAAVALGAAALIVTPVVAWDFSRDALSKDAVPLAARTDAGHDLGAIVLLVLVMLLATGLCVNFFAARQPPTRATRGLVGRGLLVVLAGAPLVLVLAVAASPGGLNVQASKAWDQLTNPRAATPANTPDRLTATSSVRARYWTEANEVFKSSPVVGTGAGAFVVARTRYRSDWLAVRHAHGYAMQTLADLGLVGLGLSLLSGVAWLIAALRATGVPWRDRAKPFDPERIGLLTMTAVVIVFGFHSLIDWTWFVPGNTVVALLCAGWVAGRAPLTVRLASDGRAFNVGFRPSRVSASAAIGVVVLALSASWAALQPVRAAHAEDAAVDALALGRYDAAASRARIAAARNPLSLDPLWTLAFVEDARGNKRGAIAALERAARSQPSNAEAWRRLGRYRLSVLGDPGSAIEPFRVALFLDPNSLESDSDLIEALRASKAR